MCGCYVEVGRNCEDLVQLVVMKYLQLAPGPAAAMVFPKSRQNADRLRNLPAWPAGIAAL